MELSDESQCAVLTDGLQPLHLPTPPQVVEPQRQEADDDKQGGQEQPRTDAHWHSQHTQDVDP